MSGDKLICMLATAIDAWAKMRKTTLSKLPILYLWPELVSYLLCFKNASWPRLPNAVVLLLPENKEKKRQVETEEIVREKNYLGWNIIKLEYRRWWVELDREMISELSNTTSEERTAVEIAFSMHIKANTIVNMQI